MLQVARLAPKLLGESAELVRQFLRRQQNDDGGFKDRTGQSDLYYTVFGLECLLALQSEIPAEPTRSFLEKFGQGEGLDFVHLCCLARCWAALINSQAEAAPSFGPDKRREIARRLQSCRSHDGGFNPVPDSEFGTAYGCFLALGACQDLKVELPNSAGLAQCLGLLETHDGAWTNTAAALPGLSAAHAPPDTAPPGQALPRSALRASHSLRGSTNATAAAVSVLRNLSLPINRMTGDWLLARCHAQGGFLAAPDAPLPDLLSTATALHALAGLDVSFERAKEKCLDFIDTLWTNEGAFYGHWGDDDLDCEYTYYGMLALGHLSF